MSQTVRLLKDQWYLISRYSCVFRIDGDGVKCHFTESITKPTDPPNKNRAGTPSVKTLKGGEEHVFDQVDSVFLWGYPVHSNGAVVVVDDRGGFPIAQETRYSKLTAFGETKVSQFSAIGAWSFAYNINSRLIESHEVNGGTVTQANSFAVLQSGTDPAGEAHIHTKRSVRYQPGYGGLIRFTAIFDTPQPDSRQLVGYGDDGQDGFFFGYIGETFGVLRVNGGVEYFTPQDDWIESVFDGFDPGKLNVYQIQFQWLGGGEIRYFVEFPDFGGFVLTHREKYANTETEVSVENPSLPLTARVRNTGNTTNITLRTPSGTAGVEGDDKNRSQRGLYGSSVTRDIVANTDTPVITIRNPDTFQGKANRLSLFVDLFKLGTAGTASKVVLFRVLEDATLTGATFTAIDADTTPAEVDKVATAYTGGIEISGAQVPFNASDEIDLTTLIYVLPPGHQVTVAALSENGVQVGVAITFDSEM